MTEPISKVVAATTTEEVNRWIEQFKNYCEAQKIEISLNNKEFIALERAYWLGIMVARGADAIPPILQGILFAYRSPMLDYKSPAKKRIRRTKAELQAQMENKPDASDDKDPA